MLGEMAQVGALLRQHFRLDWHGVHGATHWARVCLNGRILSRQLGVNPRVLQGFGLFHDLARTSEGRDPGHGQRAADLLDNLGGARLLGLVQGEYDELYDAIAWHSEANSGGTLLQQACWDAGLLALWRVGIMPDPEQVFTDIARALHFDRLYSMYYS